MKIQTNAVMKTCSIDGIEMDVPDSQTIELEFSAIDTGGGFRDAILDFSFRVPRPNAVDVAEPGDECEIAATIQNPDDSTRVATFSYKTILSLNDKDELEINGRLKDDQLSRELVGFMLHLLR